MSRDAAGKASVLSSELKGAAAAVSGGPKEKPAFIPGGSRQIDGSARPGSGHHWKPMHTSAPRLSVDQHKADYLSERTKFNMKAAPPAPNIGAGPMIGPPPSESSADDTIVRNATPSSKDIARDRYRRCFASDLFGRTFEIDKRRIPYTTRHVDLPIEDRPRLVRTGRKEGPKAAAGDPAGCAYPGPLRPPPAASGKDRTVPVHNNIPRSDMALGAEAQVSAKLYAETLRPSTQPPEKTTWSNGGAFAWAAHGKAIRGNTLHVEWDHAIAL